MMLKIKLSILYSNMGQKINNDRIGNMKQQQILPSQWAQVTGQLFDKLVGKNMSMTYNLENLEIDIPRA
jgi:hypothetical protein